MTATVSLDGRPQKFFCMSCVIEREIDEQTGRCTKCGHQVLKASTEPKADRNAGAPPRSPSSAYRAPVVQIGEAAREAEYDRRREPAQAEQLEALAPSARFDETRSVAAVNGLTSGTTSTAEALATMPAVAAKPAIPPEQGAGTTTGNGTPPPPQPLSAAPAPAPAAVVQDHPAPPPSREQDTRPPGGAQPTPPAPAGSPSAAWLAEAHALADGFLAQAAAADQRAADASAQAATFTAEAKALRKKAARFTRLLDEIPEGATASDPPSESAPVADARLKPAGTWSLKHESCIDCKRTDRPHAAHGRCGPCDRSWRYAKDRR